MRNFIVKYRLYVSAVIGISLCILVVILWLDNYRGIQKAKETKVEEVAQLIALQFKNRVQENINSLSNLKNRLEVTNGDYFEYWEYDAGLIVDQDPSFLFVEWIDKNMIIQRIEPEEGNEEALGLDISKLDYRRSDWLQTKKDSVINFTNWLVLVQGPNAFLLDAPVFYDDGFQGTITAGMSFTSQFDEVMQGLEQYHVELMDGEGTIFYEFGESHKTENTPKFTVEYAISLNGTTAEPWRLKVHTNKIFEKENASIDMFLNLGLGLALSILLSVVFYFMQVAYSAQKSSKRANETTRALIESSPVAIYTLDKQGIVRDFWNKAAEDMLGWTQEEAIGRFLPHVAKTDEKDFEKLITLGLEEGGIKNKEIVRNRKDGSQIHLRINVGKIISEETESNQMLAITEDISREKEYKEQLENSLREKEVLLSEVHHRVKNNLAIIVGLIELQKEELENEKLVMILKETQNRIYSISGVHELLYNTDSFTDITFQDYAVKLIERIRMMFNSSANHVNITYNFDSRNLNINQAIPLGLLMNELITNSFKHAFGDHSKGEIAIHLKEKEDEFIEVVYKDNGTGFDEEIFDQTSTLGVTLIKTLIRQLDSEYSIDTKNGFTFSFRFKVRGRGSHSNL